MTRRDERDDVRNRMVKVAFGTGALVCLLAGLVLYLFSDSFGLDPGTAELVAIAFLAAGVADYVILRFWDRLVARRR